MPAPFALLEQRVNAAVRTHLCNAVALIGATEVSGIFRRGYQEALAGLAGGSGLSFDCAVDDAPAVAVDDAVVIGAASYLVDDIQPDGAGWQTLLLRRS